MAQNNFAFLALLVVTSTVTLASADEQTKTVEFNVKPGGMVHTFTEKMQWLMSVGLSDDDSLFSCSLWRPQGKSYLFFTQFKAELKGAKIDECCCVQSTNNSQTSVTSHSQTVAGGQRDVTLKEDEFTVGDSTVTHKDGKFRAELSKLTIIGRTRRDEL